MSNTSTVFFFFFFNDTATTEIYTLSLHDALPIFAMKSGLSFEVPARNSFRNIFDHQTCLFKLGRDRKSTRLNSSHLVISYAVFCLKKKKNNNKITSKRIIQRHPLYYTSPRTA